MTGQSDRRLALSASFAFLALCTRADPYTRVTPRERGLHTRSRAVVAIAELGSHAMSSALPSPQDAEFLRNLARTKSFSQNPRFKKHSSLDTGVRRQSRLSSYADYYDGGESECSSSKDDEKRLLHDFGAQFYPLSPRGHRGRGEHAAVQAKVALAIVLIFAAGLLGGVFLINRSDAEDWFGVRTTLEDYGVAFKQST